MDKRKISSKRQYTDKEVRQIRGLYGDKYITYDKLARVFGGTSDNIGKVINLVYYKDVE